MKIINKITEQKTLTERDLKCGEVVLLNDTDFYLVVRNWTSYDNGKMRLVSLDDGNIWLDTEFFDFKDGDTIKKVNATLTIED